MATYKIDKMRAIKPSDKMAAKHPDRWLTIIGVFHTDKGVPLSITQKVLTFDDAKNPETHIDLAKGILTLADSERGRKAIPSISQDDILADLETLRNSK